MAWLWFGLGVLNRANALAHSLQSYITRVIIIKKRGFGANNAIKF